ncbi:hypothetical protein C2G38_2185837 [Gigaspora rosea]|uniref:Uncharacterized protein n=1 Tax=Gigaspora rosea TaxID=44941 RepID=A0A397V7U7_9GLOM|nr:hypothetical protein C2G38_2185837 [Gigaspora rosea]
MTNRNKVQIKEISTYPISNNILYQEYKNNTIVRSFNYIIIKEGVYLNINPIQKQQQSDNIEKKRSVRQYKIPHNYIIETTWGRFTQQTIRCEINYLNKILQYQICYGFNFQNKIFSAKSTSDVANKYEQVI